MYSYGMLAVTIQHVAAHLMVTDTRVHMHVTTRVIRGPLYTSKDMIAPAVA